MSGLAANSGTVLYTDQELPVGIETFDDVFFSSFYTVQGAGYPNGAITFPGGDTRDNIEFYLNNMSSTSRTWIGIVDVTLTTK